MTLLRQLSTQTQTHTWTQPSEASALGAVVTCNAALAADTPPARRRGSVAMLVTSISPEAARDVERILETPAPDG